jgi:photosystem II stability/assembly factor-like uncharacterized protein
MAACDDGNGGGGDTTPSIASFSGTWNASGGRSIVFTGSAFVYKVNGSTDYSGTFSVSGSTITFNESSLGSASGSFSLSGNTLVLSNHIWDSSVNGTYTKEGGSGGNLDLSGSVTIYNYNYTDTDFPTGSPMYASYNDGNETVTFQWKMGGSNVGAASTDNPNTYTPEEPGSYTVTVSAEGYKSKTSAAVTVTGEPLPDLEGNVTINPSTDVITGKKLTATYTGSEEWVSYQWKNGANAVGTNSNEYTPTEAGSYTVTVSAAGYKSKTSAAVTVTAPLPWVWTTVADSPFITGGQINSGIYAMAYGNNKFVAGGQLGIMAYSADGVTWTAVTDSTFGNTTIYGIAYGNNTWVAGDNYGKMAYSKDNGVTWTAVGDNKLSDDRDPYISDIAYANGRFIAVGSSIVYSDDGETWTRGNSSGSSGGSSIAYGNGRWIAGRGNARISYSDDNGETWTDKYIQQMTTSSVDSIAYGNSRWVAGIGNRIWYSDNNGETWSQITDSYNGSISGIAYGNGRFVAGTGNGNTTYSDDGETWTEITGGVWDFHRVQSIAYGNGKFVAGGSTRISYASY